MLSHDPTLGTARTRLREALEHSAAGKFLRGARAAWADAWSHGRALTKPEIRSLETQGNRSADWNALRILGKGSAAFLNDIQGCRFEGQNILDVGHGNPRLVNSLIRDCRIGAATVESVLLLNRVIVEDGAVLRHLGECVGTPESRFCLGLAVHPGSETGARRVYLADGLLLEDCAAMAALPYAGQEALATEWRARLRHCVSDHAFVGAGARIEHTRFVEDCYVGAGAVIRGASALRHSVIGSSGHDPVIIGDNALVEHCVLEAGVRIDSAAQVRRTLFLEHSGAEQGGHVADSVIGPNTIVAKGEVTASLVGPFVGFHHQALLIGTLWPEGRGNVGYGANVGSNHTGRKPDQELRPGEGTFFGLACAIKFPADFSEAPYSLFATGVVTPPQKIAFPFSLITAGSAAENVEGQNEILPGWMWSENAYALIRTAYKYADRNRARNHALPEIVPDPNSPLFGTFLASDLFAPRIAARVRKALAALEAIPAALPPTAVLTEAAVPGLGKNCVRAAWIEKARAAYRNYLAIVDCRELLWDATPAKASKSVAQEVRDTIEVFEGLAEAVESSLRRDADRGTRVFPDYADFHGAASEDAVCMRLKTELKALTAVLRQRLSKP
jgi:hypothetical protein